MKKGRSVQTSELSARDGPWMDPFPLYLVTFTAVHQMCFLIINLADRRNRTPRLAGEGLQALANINLGSADGADACSAAWP